ncbi:MAG: D-alanyl-D-alanine carboxypeptidase/D-alanyl-D-alanine-endopeptidase [Phycisphaerae bacterium]|nr:D-alanyl-D-alanine carboxypeptidase/D-alanyl-D-alanine-endopeptidase [Phycisphaerae bacterium]
MRTLLRSLTLVASASLAGATPNAAASPTARDLNSDVQRIVRSLDLKKARVSVSVRDADSDAAIVAIDAERPMMPASNMKLLTTGAFLATFGADFSFRTRMMKVGENLVIRGDGDPAFGDPDLLADMTWTSPDGKEHKGLDIDELLRIWVDAVKASGFTAIDEVIVDARVFDSVAYHPNWPKDQYKEDYCAEVWGFNFHHNLLHVWPRPRSGSAADVSRLDPDLPSLVRSNSTTSRTGPQDRHTFWINRPPDQNAFTFNGNVKTAATDPASVTLHDVPALFARVFADRLRAAGVTVRSQREAKTQDPEYSGDTVGPEIRTPIATVLFRCNTDSDNLYAESLLKRLGYGATKAPGSWSNGAAAMRHAIASRLSSAALAATINPDDGSGLSRENKITAAAMTAWINTFHRDATLGPTFIHSFAIGGRTGTVKKRFKDVEKTGCTVQCKTGFIRGVSCLSGLVTASDGRRMSFSILCNDLVEADAVGKAKLMQEKIVTAVADALNAAGNAAGRREALGGG